MERRVGRGVWTRRREAPPMRAAVLRTRVPNSESGKGGVAGP